MKIIFANLPRETKLKQECNGLRPRISALAVRGSIDYQYLENHFSQALRVGCLSMTWLSAGGRDNHRWSARWYAVYSQPHREKRAAANLENQGFRVFLPLFCKTVRHARQFRTVHAPFFPRYLFVQLTMGHDRWRCVNSTLGVCCLIMEGEAPKPVPPGIVEGMLAIADQAGLLSPDPRLRPGQRARIVTGPFTGLVGTLLALDDNQRVKVLVDILGNPTLVALSARCVGLVPAA